MMSRGAAPATWLLAVVPLVLWFVVSSRDHHFRDELYFMVAGRHLDLGYVDFPMLTAVLAALSARLFGDSLVGLRLLPALAGSMTVLLTGMMAREMGGGRLAQFLAALAALVAPVFLATNLLFGPDAFDRTLWVAGSFVVARMLHRDTPRLWLVFGAIAAIGLLTKLTVLVFGFAVVVGLVLGGRGRLLLSPWAFGGGALALTGLVPYVVWQARHGWATLTFWANYGGKLAELSRGEFALQQILGMNPGTLPIWGVGLYSLLVTRAGRPFRPLGLAFLVALAVCLMTRAKSYVLAPAYPVLLAAGAVVLADTRGAVRRFVVAPYAVLLAISGVAMAAMAAPLFAPPTTARFFALMGAERVRQEKHTVAELPQYLADRYGWEEMVATVADVYRSLDPEEQHEACILMASYGRAAAIDFYGPRHGLPGAISGHNNYHFWGPRGCTGRVVITTGRSDRALRPFFERLERAATVTCAYCLPSENNLPVWVARNATRPMAAIWPALKHFD